MIAYHVSPTVRGIRNIKKRPPVTDGGRRVKIQTRLRSYGIPAGNRKTVRVRRFFHVWVLKLLLAVLMDEMSIILMLEHAEERDL